MKLFFLIGIAAFLSLSCNNQQKDKVEEETSDSEKSTIKVDPSMNNISRSKDIATLLTQHWEHKSDHEMPYLNEDDEDPAPMRAFYFFKDGTLTKDPRNNMQRGKWSYDNATKQIDIELTGGIKKRYKIKSISYKKLMLLEEGESQVEEYRAAGVTHKNDVDDPFYASNIQWMIKPTAAEDDAAIRQRVKSCVHFYYLFHADQYKRDAKEVFFYGFPGCFNWYAGGIYLKKENKLSKKWKAIFFNEENAHKGYQIVDKMMSQSYVWDKKESNWLKQNADVLKQMENQLGN